MTTTRRDERMRSATHAWMRALERTAVIGREPALILPLLIDRLAERFGEAAALIAPDSRLSYRALAEASHRVARWGLGQPLVPGDVVCLLMKNCPEYLAIWLGLSRIGVTVALVNTHLAGEPLRHAIDVVRPRLAIAGAEHAAILEAVRRDLSGTVDCWAYGGGRHALPRL
ncbi:MAG TPA: AMP-binding protein, partial [Steroidobacteraceae bacterium]|nr:AMP-binding protein [Steroidobacteraceae bacterium]